MQASHGTDTPKTDSEPPEFPHLPYRMPALFIGHGSPMNAIEDSEFSRAWAEAGQSITKPKAILCISAHWETVGTRVTAMERPRTIHDFHGFPKPLFDMEYPAPGDPALARLIRESVADAPIILDSDWGLDHGAWSVLCRMFPQADIPVVQLSLDRTKEPAFHYGLGKSLRELRNRGILIVGSGNIVHNLGAVVWQDTSHDWALAFDQQIKRLIASCDRDAIIAKFSANARQIFEHFAFDEWLVKLESANLLYLVTQKFATIDLHPDVITNHEMGLVFEHLIRKFAESSNDDAGQFFTPRDVVRLATTLVISPHRQALMQEGIIRTIYDCAAGTGGFLSSGIELVEEWNPAASITPYAQELNPETYAIAVADKLIKGYDTKNIKLGNTLSHDLLPFDRFDYCLANPPFGVKWENVQTKVQKEHDSEGYSGRFGPGLPRIGDGSLLFLLHLLSKRKPVAEGGTRIGIVLSGSPLFNGGAGSGESEIRRWILEQDWLETIVALPNDLFYNTGIGTYIWILSNHKEERRQGKVQLIDASGLYAAMGKSLGSKRKVVTDDQIAEIARLHGHFAASPIAKIFDTIDFGYRRITVERPLRLRVRLDGQRIDSLRHLPELQSHMQWMEGQFGLECHKSIENNKTKITDHVHAALGLEANMTKEERKKLEKDALGILKKLLDQKAWERRSLLSEAVRDFWAETRQTHWNHYSLFEYELSRHIRANSLVLTAADIKHLRVWLTVKDTDCLPVVAEKCPAKPGQETLFGFFLHEDGKVRVYESDPDLREFENVPLKQDIRDYFTSKVLPHVPDAWIDAGKRDPQDKAIGIVGYEINFNRYFYQYQPPRPLAEIDAELKAVEADIAALLGEVTA